MRLERLRTLIITFAVGTGIVYGLSYGVGLAPSTKAPPLPRPLKSVPLTFKGWVGVEQEMDEEVVKVLNVSEYLSRVYRSPKGDVVSLYVGYYGNPVEAGAHLPTSCMPGHGWGLVKEDRVKLPLAEGPDAPTAEVVRMHFRDRQGRESLVLYWYETSGVVSSNRFLLRITTTLNRLMGTDPPSAIKVQLYTPVTVNVEEAYRRLVAFNRVFFPYLKRCLPHQRGKEEGEEGEKRKEEKLGGTPESGLSRLCPPGGGPVPTVDLTERCSPPAVRMIRSWSRRRIPVIVGGR